MLLVVTKSAAALVLGGAMLGQQADNANRNVENQDVAPPAPTLQAPQEDVDRPQARDQQQTQQNLDRPAARSDGAINQRQTFDQRQIQNDQRQLQNQDQSLHQNRQDSQGRSALGVTLTDDVRVMQVSPGSPAEQMGLRPGDEILSLNGQAFDSVDAFMGQIGSIPQGQEIQLEIDRDGQNMPLTGQLAAWDRVHYSGTHMAGKGLQHQGYAQQGVQHHSAMRFADDGSMIQGTPVDAGFAVDPCCDPCAGFGGFHGGFSYSSGYGYADWDGGWGRREARRAARRGYYW